MSLPPLANLLAVATPDPAELLTTHDAIEADPAFDAPWSPAPGWLVAVSRLPGSSADGEPVRAAGLAFAQGREEVAGSGRSWKDVARLVAERPDDLAVLPGDFGLVHIASKGSATLVRSAGGLVPFYVAGGGERWTVATTLAHLLRFHRGQLGLDPLLNAIWTSGSEAAPDHRTFVAGALVAGRGEYVRLSGALPVFARYWDPRRGVRPRPAPDHAPRLRSALLRTLERDLDPEGGNLLTLSGGVDSSSIGALAAGVLGREVSTLTTLPVDDGPRARNLRYIDALDGAVGFHKRTEVILDAERRLTLLQDAGVPFHVPQPFLCLLPAVAREQPVSVIVGGELADQTVGSTGLLYDWARHTTLTGLWRTRRRLPTGPRDLRPWLAYRVRRRVMHRVRVPFPGELPPPVRAELRAEYDEWLDRRVAAAARDRGPMPYLAMYLERHGFLGMHWEVTSALGIRRCLPFVTREVLELAFECHPSELVGPGSKRLLRDALREDVPALNLERPDKGTSPQAPDRVSRRWRGEIPGALEPILEPGWPPARGAPPSEIYRVTQMLVFLREFDKARSKAPHDRREHGSW